jgi:hypothetical protein
VPALRAIDAARKEVSNQAATVEGFSRDSRGLSFRYNTHQATAIRDLVKVRASEVE